MAMKALDRSAALIRRGDTLRARSVRIRAAVDEKVEKSRWRPCRAPYAAGNVTRVDPGSGEDSARLKPERLEAVRVESRALRQFSAEARVRAQTARGQARQGRSQRETLHESAFARLLAKMGTMSVIEQAKGIVIAQRGCGPDEAFDLLRQMSQQANVKVHVLAAQIVEHAASHSNDIVTPVARGAARDLRPPTADTATRRP